MFLNRLKMALNLIPVCNRLNKVLFYIERKPNDKRSSLTIVKEYKTKLKNSEISLKIKNQKMKF